MNNLNTKYQNEINYLTDELKEERVISNKLRLEMVEYKSYEYDEYNEDFGKVDWEEIELKVNWIRPDELICSKFILDGISYLRNSEYFFD